MRLAVQRGEDCLWMSIVVEDVHESTDGLLVGGGCLHPYPARVSRNENRDIVEYAYKAGARFDGWDECFKAGIWRAAFQATGIDPAFYAHRERSTDEVLPWTHLHGGAPDDYLKRQYADALTQLKVRQPTQGVSA